MSQRHTIHGAPVPSPALPLLLTTPLAANLVYVCVCVCCLPPPPLQQHEPEAAAPLEVDQEPFRYRPLSASSHVYEMVDGVVRVWPDAQAR